MLNIRVEENYEKNNFITHRVALYNVAYVLSKKGYDIEIDTSLSKYGHIVIHKDKGDISVIIKSLSKLYDAIFSSNELKSEFKYVIVCVNVYEEKISYYKLDMQYVKNESEPSPREEGKKEYYLAKDKYTKFKVDSMLFN